MDPCEETESEIALACLDHLKQERCDNRADWLRVAASLKAVSDDDVMRGHFIKWSKQSPKFVSVEDCVNLWASLDRGSLNTLIQYAEADGYFIPGAKATVIVDADEKRVADDTVTTFRRADNLFARGNILVRVSRSTPIPPKINRERDAPRIEALSPAALREQLATLVDFKRYNAKRQLIRCHVPAWLPAAIDSRPSWPVPTIEAVSEIPLVRDDGTIIRKPGFDRDTGVFFAPTTIFPTVESVDEARDALLEVVTDFPFTSELHRSAWFASLLTPPARLAFDGPSPLHLIDANCPGAGKGLLVAATAIIGCGRPMAITSAPESDAEWRKRITALALAGEPVCLIDNIANELASPSLDAALTATTWSDRILGVSKTVTLPLRVSWFGTGNNIALHRDTLRRVNYVRLESRVEKPEERSGFKHPQLLSFIREHRGYLAGCALAILSGYCRAGRPDMKLSPFGSFEEWSGLVRSSIVWCGLPDPMATRAMLAESSDTDGECLRQLLAGWQEADAAGVGLTAAEAFDAIEHNPDKFTTLRAVLTEFNRNRQALGIRLNKYRSRVCGGHCFTKVDRGRTTVWKVIAA
jgi:hypothetical protein